MTYPDGEVVNYEYNDRMLLDKVYNLTSTYVDSTTYDSAGRMDVRTFGNNTQTDYDYYSWSTAGRALANPQVGHIGQSPRSLQNLNYNYDAGGNISRLLDYIGGPKPNLWLRCTRPIDQRHGTGGSTGHITETYTYDFSHRKSGE